MPGGDGTGPMGMGPMTGGGRGFCVMHVSGVRPRPIGRRFLGRGGDETAMLKEEASFLKEELSAIQERLDVLEKSQGPKE